MRRTQADRSEQPRGHALEARVLRIRPEDDDLEAAQRRARLAATDSEAPETPARPTSWQPGRADKRYAVFVTHGMGQQLPFESAAMVAEGLIAHHPQFAGQTVPLRACNRATESGRRQHLEFQALDADGQRVEVHVHEGYWAPLTEGRVHVGDVLRFLYSGAFNSLRTRRFTRYMFGRTVDCKMPAASHFRLLMTTVVLSFFVFMNFAVASTVVGLVLREGFNVQAVRWPSQPLIEILSRIVALFASATVLFAILMWFTTSLKSQLRRRGWWKSARVRRAWRRVATATQVGAWGWYAVTGSSFLLMLLAVAADQRDPATFGTWAAHFGEWPLRIQALLWLLMFVAFGIMRKKLVQYMGDVASYVSPHVLDRFMNIRQDIKRWVVGAAHDVYGLERADGTHEYDAVVLVGHSLGSVVAYDTLNALLNADAANDAALRVAERTRMLVTFGSPLDKTAFIFSQHRKPQAETRGLMAAAVQPLICSYEHFRRIEWVNIYSKRDPVSDALELYDDPTAEDFDRFGVRNVHDCDACVPLAAHMEYWDNACLYGQIWRGLGVPARSEEIEESKLERAPGARGAVEQNVQLESSG